MLAHVAEEFEVAELAHPIVVVHQDGRVRAAIEIEEPPQLRLHAGDVRPEGFEREQVAFLALAAGVADHAGGPAHHGDRPMSGLLKPPQDHQRHQVADVQAVGRRIEAGVDVRGFSISSRGRFASSVVWLIRPRQESSAMMSVESGEWRVESGEWRTIGHGNSFSSASWPSR